MKTVQGKLRAKKEGEGLTEWWESRLAGRRQFFLKGVILKSQFNEGNKRAQELPGAAARRKIVEKLDKPGVWDPCVTRETGNLNVLSLGMDVCRQRKRT